MAISTSIIPKTYVKVQATQPSTGTEGDLWYDTATETLYSYDGTTWNLITPDVDYIDSQQLQQALAILALQADASITPSDYNTIFLDTFSDANGYDNTLDTASTTAVFDSANNQYNNSWANDTWNVAHASSGSQTAKRGGKFTVGGTTVTLISVVKHSVCTATTAYLTDASRSVIASATFSGDTATFATPQTLTTATEYYVVCDSGGGSYTSTFNNSVSSAYSGTYIDWTTAQILATTDDANSGAVNIDYLVINGTPANKIIQTDTITIDADATAYQVYSNKTIAGTGTVDYKISFDDGSNYTTAKTLNTKYSNTTTGTSIKIQLQLNGTGSGNTAVAKDYALLVWY